MIRRPPRSTPLYSSAASDVYKRQSQVLADRPSKKRRPEEVQRSDLDFIRSQDPSYARYGSRSNLISGGPVKARRTSFLKTSTISRPESVPGRGIDVRSAITAADSAGHHRKKVSVRGFQGRPPRSPHPVYLGMGNDAVDAAYTTYLDIVATSARNQRKAAVNPVSFVGRR